MDNCIRRCHSYGAICMISCEQEMGNTEDPYETACTCRIFFEYPIHAEYMPHITIPTSSLDKEVKSWPLWRLSSGLIFLRYFRSAIDNRTVHVYKWQKIWWGIKFGDLQTTCPFTKFKSSPNIPAVRWYCAPSCVWKWSIWNDWLII